MPDVLAATRTAIAPDQAVSAWIDAFNARHLDGLLEHLHPAIELHPLRLNGLAVAYHGHDGGRERFAQLDPGGIEHRIDLSAVRVAADGRVLAVGTLCLADQAAIAPFGAVHRLENGRIIDARHYFSDQTLLARLGLFP